MIVRDVGTKLVMTTFKSLGKATRSRAVARVRQHHQGGVERRPGLLDPELIEKAWVVMTHLPCFFKTVKDTKLCPDSFHLS